MQLQLYYAIQKKFPNEYISVIFIQIDQHLKMLFKKYKWVQILWNMMYKLTCFISISACQLVV